MKNVTLANIGFAFLEEGCVAKFLPLDALYLAAVLEKASYRVDFRDYQQVSTAYLDPLDPGNAEAFFRDSSTIVIVICTNETIPFALLLIQELKKLAPEKVIILGGIGTTGVAEEILKHFPFVDAVVKGEGEATFVELLDRMGGGLGEVRGIAFRDETGVCTGPHRERIRDLDSLPFPAYHRVNLDDYDEIMIRSCRGCPYQCAFCDRMGLLTRRNIDIVIEEIRMLRDKYGQKRFFLYDQTFTLDRERVLEFCRKLRKERLGDVEWSCTGRINLVDSELMEEMSRSGCSMIYLGVESGSDRVLKRIKKRITREQAEKVISEAVSYFSVSCFFIWGFPFETMIDFYMTMDFIEEVSRKGVGPILYTWSPLPLSQLFQEFRESLWFSRECWEASWPASLSNPLSRERVAGLIVRYPTVFPGFYVCDAAIHQKLKVVKELGLETHYPD